MKKAMALLLACLLLLPAAAMAQPVSQKDYTITLTYNGQRYDCTYNYFAKCCGEADTSYDLWVNPIGGEETVGSFNLNVPFTAKTGDVFRVEAGETLQWLSIYVVRKDGTQHFVSPPGSILGSGLLDENDYFEVEIHSLVKERGISHIQTTARGRFFAGEVEMAIEMDVSL